MKPVTRQQHQAAQYAAAKLKPLADALAAVDDQVLGYNDEAIAKLVNFIDFIALKILEADRVITQAQNQYEERDRALIGAATSRFFAIDADIAAAKSRQAALLQSHKNKVEELVKQGFLPEEIDGVLVNPIEELDALDTAIAVLAAEKLSVQKYLADAPRFDETLLAGTGVFAVRETQAALKGMVPKL